MSLLGRHLYSHPVEQDGLQVLAFPYLRFPVGDYVSLVSQSPLSDPTKELICAV